VVFRVDPAEFNRGSQVGESLQLADSERERIQRVLIALFAEKLSVHVPSEMTDLFESGILDSQKFVELLLHIEDHFKIAISVEDFETDNFRCVGKIAGMIWRRKNASLSVGVGIANIDAKIQKEVQGWKRF